MWHSEVVFSEAKTRNSMLQLLNVPCDAKILFIKGLEAVSSCLGFWSGD